MLQHQRDVRVGSGPTIHGERLVLRLMPDNKAFTQLDELGFDDEQVADIRKYIHRPYGMVLSVGPVGSGKSTTMYACLELLNDPAKSLVTIATLAGPLQISSTRLLGARWSCTVWRSSVR